MGEEKNLTRPVWKGGSETLEINFILQARIKKDIPGGIVLVKKTQISMFPVPLKA